jgi:hypothetical protein
VRVFSTRLPLLAIALLCALAQPAAASAAKAEVLDPRGDVSLNGVSPGGGLDLERVSLEKSGSMTAFLINVFVGNASQRGKAVIAVDTNGVAGAERLVQVELVDVEGSPVARWDVFLVAAADGTCQRIGVGTFHQDAALSGQLATMSIPQDQLGSPARARISAIAFTGPSVDRAPDDAVLDSTTPHCAGGGEDDIAVRSDGAFGALYESDAPVPDSPQEPTPSPQPTPTPSPQPAPEPTPPAPAKVLYSTAKQYKVPNFAGLDLDVVRDRILDEGVYADFDFAYVRSSKPLGTVVKTAPAAGSVVTVGLGRKAKVKITVSRGDGSRCDAQRLAKFAVDVDFDVVFDVAKEAKCRIARSNFRINRFNDAATVRRASVVNSSAIALDLVEVPIEKNKHDLILGFREGPRGVSFAAADFRLTAVPGIRVENSFTVKVWGRDGRPVPKAKVYVDASDVGSPDLPARETNAAGDASVILNTENFNRGLGSVDVVVVYEGANGVPMIGAHSLLVQRRELRLNGVLETTTGRRLKLTRNGFTDIAAARTAPRARMAAWSIGGFLGWLFGGNVAQTNAGAVANGPGTPDKKLATLRDRFKLAPMQIGTSTKPIGDDVGRATIRKVELVKVDGNNVVAAGGGNAVASGGANAVAAGGANAVAAGGGNIIGQAAANIIGQAAANVIQFKDGTRLISDNGLGLMSDNGLGLVSRSSGGLLPLSGAVASGGLN